MPTFDVGDMATTTGNDDGLSKGTRVEVVEIIPIDKDSPLYIHRVQIVYRVRRSDGFEATLLHWQIEPWDGVANLLDLCEAG